MKAKYIFASLTAALTILAGCQKEVGSHYLDEVSVSSSYVSVPAEGGSATIGVLSNYAWSISGAPEWLTVSPLSGPAGSTNVTFSAEAAAGRNAELLLECNGAVQRINVIQGIATVSNATCAEIIAGPDSKTYRVTGTVKSIANTTYGNWYLVDDTGEVYIYGTLDAKGNEKNFLSLGLEVGDEVTVEGPKTTYNGTVELVNVTVVKINKSLIKVESIEPEDAVLPIEGGDFTVTLAKTFPLNVVGDASYATLYLPVDVTTDGTTKAYYVTTTNNGYAQLTATANDGTEIPARTAVVLVNSEAATTTAFTRTSGLSSAVNESTNLLKGTLVSMSLDLSDGTDNYSLGKLNGEIGFYKFSGGTITLGANKAYLEAPAAGGAVKGFTLSFGGEDGILQIENETWTMDNEAGAWYDLNGRKLIGVPAAKGVYIVGGKKVIVK
jgi:hypothetical protein